MTDTIFSDVSEFQVPVDDSYTAAGYGVLSIRACDGTYQDHNFAHNYQWAAAAADSGKLSCFIVYAYWRPNWQATAQTMIDMVTAQGGPHPAMIAMIDLESGGNPGGDQSDGVNGMYWQLANWLGNPLRVIGYANSGDFYSMWVTRPAGLRVIGAGYGQNPNLPGQIAHQYTDGVYGAGQGLPMGAPPFGNCDMNSADGLDPAAFAAACGIGTTGEDPMAGVNVDGLNTVIDKLLATSPDRCIYRDSDDNTDDTVGKVWSTFGMTLEMVVEHEAMLGDPSSIAKVQRLASGQGPGAKDQWAIDRAKRVLALCPGQAAAS